MSINQYVNKPLSVDALVGDGGNWFVAYVYCNWGADHVLMLLPSLDSKDDEINASCMNIPDGTQEEAYLVGMWIQKHPETPFLVNGCDGFKACVDKMEKLLSAYNGDWDKFIDDSSEFDDWRKVAHYVYTSSEEGPAYRALDKGWESLKEEAGCIDPKKEKKPSKEPLIIGPENIIIFFMQQLHVQHISYDKLSGLVEYLNSKLREHGADRYSAVVMDCGFMSVLRFSQIRSDIVEIIDEEIYVSRPIQDIPVNCDFYVRDLIMDYVGKLHNKSSES